MSGKKSRRQKYRNRAYDSVSKSLFRNGKTSKPYLPLVETAVIIASEMGWPAPEGKATAWQIIIRYAAEKNGYTIPVVIPFPKPVRPPKPKFDAQKARKKAREAFYASDEWRTLRYQALKLHGGKCQCCGRSPPAVVLHVDHIKPRKTHPELELVLSNLQVLCADCNLGKSAKDSTDWRKEVG